MNIPTSAQQNEILDRYKTPKHIKRHAIQVSKVALFLGKKLKANGIRLNLELLRAACILHDVLKLVDFQELSFDLFDKEDLSEKNIDFWKKQYKKYKGISHEDLAYSELKDDYPEMARIIKRHRFSAIGDMKYENWGWEDKILTYSDKRVLHDKIVTLTERFTEGHARYGTEPFNNMMPSENDSRFFELEKEIFNIIGLEPDKLKEYIT